MSTPRTDGIEGEAYQYKWDCKVVHSEFARQLETELTEMRQAMSQVATNIGNGSFATMDASHEWMTKEVPEEIRVYCEQLRRELAAEREKVAKLRKEVTHAIRELGIADDASVQEYMDQTHFAKALLRKALEQTK